MCVCVLKRRERERKQKKLSSIRRGELSGCSSNLGVFRVSPSRGVRGSSCAPVNHPDREICCLDGETLLQKDDSVLDLCHHLSVAPSLDGECGLGCARSLQKVFMFSAHLRGVSYRIYSYGSKTFFLLRSSHCTAAL